MEETSLGGVVNLITKQPSQEASGYVKEAMEAMILFLDNLLMVEVLPITQAGFAAESIERGEGYYDCLNAGCENKDILIGQLIDLRLDPIYLTLCKRTY